jgi:hypothetical protein
MSVRVVGTIAEEALVEFPSSQRAMETAQGEMSQTKMLVFPGNISFNKAVGAFLTFPNVFAIFWLE